MKANNAKINEYRQSKIYGRPIRSEGNNGIFRVPFQSGYLNCVVSDGSRDGWEHVSVSYKHKYRGKWQSRIPKWEEMCFIKDMFWDEDEVVIQIHPAKSNYVNNHPHVLHLWKPLNESVPLPPLATVRIPGFDLDPENPQHAQIAAGIFFEANRKKI